MRNALIAVLLMAAITGCRKHDPLCAGCGTPILAKGIVFANIDDSVPVESVFSLLDSLSLPIENVQGYAYNSAWPADSFAAFSNYLRSRTYIDTTTVISQAPLHVTCSFLAMNLAAQQDWLALKSQLMLTESYGFIKRVEIQVPDGKEQVWADSLNKFAIVKHADVLILAP